MAKRNPKHGDTRIETLWHPVLGTRRIVQRWDEPIKGAGCWVWMAEA
jgi:hypothetical protein